jgi:hypothetical protein
VIFFKTHPHLSHIDKSMVEYPYWKKKLMQIQATGIWIFLLDVVKKIDVILSKWQLEMGALP